MLKNEGERWQRRSAPATDEASDLTMILHWLDSLGGKDLLRRTAEQFHRGTEQSKRIYRMPNRRTTTNTIFPFPFSFFLLPQTIYRFLFFYFSYIYSRSVFVFSFLLRSSHFPPHFFHPLGSAVNGDQIAFRSSTICRVHSSESATLTLLRRIELSRSKNLLQFL